MDRNYVLTIFYDQLIQQCEKKWKKKSCCRAVRPKRKVASLNLLSQKK